MLPKKARLRSERDIRAAIKARQYQIKCPLLHLVGRDNQQETTRVAIVTPKSLGNAVIRNRMRRILATAFTRILHKINKNIDLVVFPKPAAYQASSDSATATLTKLLGNRELLK